MTSYGLPHLDLIISLSCHSLNLTCTRLVLRDPVSMPLRSSGTAPIHSPRCCTLLSLRLVLSPSTTLSVFGHCLSIVLYKLGLCSTSTLVRIPHHVLVTSLSLYPCPLNSTCPLDSLTRPSCLFPLSRPRT